MAAWARAILAHIEVVVYVQCVPREFVLHESICVQLVQDSRIVSRSHECRNSEAVMSRHEFMWATSSYDPPATAVAPTQADTTATISGGSDVARNRKP